MVKQVSVFVENKPGTLAKVSKALGDEKINIRAFSVAEVGEFGIVRLIVNDPEKANYILREKGYTSAITDVLAVEMGDEPGSLAEVAGILGDSQINIEYAYALLEREANKAVLIARVDNIEKAKNILIEANFRLLTPEEVYSL
ncbi:MAG: ACT domain-containing protein [Candidatus Hydrothermarchaeota archaeon]